MSLINVRPLLIATLATVWLAVLPAPAQTASLPPRTFLHPDRIRYDRQCLTIDGKDVFLYSGAFHYFRCPKPLWAARFEKIKAAGFNGVETYVAWNWCERQKPAGLDDFSQVELSDLDDFLTMAEQYGLYVLVRPGPYICAEWDTGGYPQWLNALKPGAPLRSQAWLRTDDPVYLDWCRHWYRAVCPVIAKHQITRKAPGQPGVILVQLENEYDYAGLPAEVMLNQVRALGETARAAGIDVPFFTCWTHPVRGAADPLIRQAFDACNFYPRWGVDGVQGDIDQLRREQPDAPLATTELQGGWFSQVGGKLSENQDGVTGSQINNLTLFTIQNGETILNYYMLYGGFNPDDWGALGLTTTYDYAAPIREWGGTGERYQRVWALGHMLREHGTRLARSEKVEVTVAGVPKDVTVVERRAADGGRYLFVRTSQHKEPRAGTAQVQEAGAATLAFDYSLEPFGSKVLYLPAGVKDAAQGVWLPKPAPAVERPAAEPAPVAITSARTRTDNGPAADAWHHEETHGDLAAAGVYDSHFLFYQARAESSVPTNLLVTFSGWDQVLASVNGQPAAAGSGNHGTAHFSLPAGSSRITLLFENHGHPNGGTGMEAASGIKDAKLISPLAGRDQHFHWQMRRVANPDKRPEVKPEFDASGWPTVSVEKVDADQLKPGESAVFRAEFTVTNPVPDGGRQMLCFARIDDLGWVYLNGRLLGKTTDWDKEYEYDVTETLQPGRNVIAVVVKNEKGAGGLGGVTLGLKAEGHSVPLAQWSRPQGDLEQWWQPGLAEEGWQPVSLGTVDHAAAGASLTWYRMNFTLPATEPGVWVPWHLHLEAAGNGFLYLNGQPLGRYWEAGPQHDFYLPECWLNTASGATNQLTLDLRATGKGLGVTKAVVEPYAGFAEKRP